LIRLKKKSVRHTRCRAGVEVEGEGTEDTKWADWRVRQHDEHHGLVMVDDSMNPEPKTKPQPIKISSRK